VKPRDTVSTLVLLTFESNCTLGNADGKLSVSSSCARDLRLLWPSKFNHTSTLPATMKPPVRATRTNDASGAAGRVEKMNTKAKRAPRSAANIRAIQEASLAANATDAPIAPLIEAPAAPVPQMTAVQDGHLISAHDSQPQVILSPPTIESWPKLLKLTLTLL
jgi:hypothetical protein